MTKVKIICITQNSSYDRQLSILRLVTRLNQIGKVKFQVVFIGDSCTTAFDFFVNHSYHSKHWHSDLKIGQLYFAANINPSFFGHQSLSLSISKIFPARLLSPPEHDVTFKHFQSLMFAAKTDVCSIIFEDDAVIEARDIACFYNLVAQYLDHKHLYFDFCKFPCFVDFQDNDKVNKVMRLDTAVTRTLCGYMVSPGIAKDLIVSFLPYALPADLHMQKLLFELSIPGFLAFPGIVINGSKASHFQSLIDSHL